MLENLPSVTENAISRLVMSMAGLDDELPETDEYPSGGVSAAVVAALAASLAAAAADHSREHWDDAGGARAQAQALRRRAAELAERDAAAFAAARSALARRRPEAEVTGDDDARNWRLGVAVGEAARPPLELAATAADIAELAGIIAVRGADEVRADAVIAAKLAAAAARSAAILVRINLVLGGDQQSSALAQRWAEAAAAAAASVDAVDL
jgi:formiminotetrahydrofolate cyclodeaminase